MAQKQLYGRNCLLDLHSTLKQVCAACLVWGIGFIGLSLFFKTQPPLSRVFVVLATGTAITGLYIWRHLFYRFLRQDSFAAKLRQWSLLVGWPPHSKLLSDII